MASSKKLKLGNSEKDATKHKSSKSIGERKRGLSNGLDQQNNPYFLTRDSHRGFSVKGFMPISENAELEYNQLLDSNEGIGTPGFPGSKFQFGVDKSDTNRNSYPVTAF